MLLPLLLAAPTLHAGVPKSDLDEQGRGIIQNYDDMSEGGHIEWIWVAPGTNLSKYRFEVKGVENLTTSVDDDMGEVMEKVLPRALARSTKVGADAPLLTVDGAIYWAQRANRAKLWIPYAGGHLAQAGVGIELVFKDASGNVVATLRHSGREGDKLEDAANELVEEINGFIRSH